MVIRIGLIARSRHYCVAGHVDEDGGLGPADTADIAWCHEHIGEVLTMFFGVLLAGPIGLDALRPS